MGPQPSPEVQTYASICLLHILTWMLIGISHAHAQNQTPVFPTQLYSSCSVPSCLWECHPSSGSCRIPMVMLDFYSLAFFFYSTHQQILLTLPANIYLVYDSLEPLPLSSPLCKPPSFLTCLSLAPDRLCNPHSRQKDPMVQKSHHASPGSEPCSGFFSHSGKAIVLSVA